MEKKKIIYINKYIDRPYQIIFINRLENHFRVSYLDGLTTELGTEIMNSSGKEKIHGLVTSFPYDSEFFSKPEVKELSTEKLVMVCRVIMGAHVDKMTIPELKRDILMYSKNEPEDFLGILDDPMLDLQDSVFQLFDKGVIAIRNNNKDVYLDRKSVV